ncbi:MAG TPA: MarC family protein [Terriglobales bacterium]|nr:MarC family protein [Terriglobales bacterium]
MWSSFESAWQFALVAFSSVFFLVDPFAAIPAFLSITHDADEKRRRRTARRASWTCFFVLTTFAAAGSYLMKLLGITMPALEIAGGLIMLRVGMEMLQAQRSQSQETATEAQEGAEKEEAGIIPLGIPMLAGPGAISTVMVLMGPSPELWRALPIFVAIAVTSLSAYWIFTGADRVRAVLGQTGIRVMMRLMGLLLTAVAIQFAINGMTHLGVLKR